MRKELFKRLRANYRLRQSVKPFLFLAYASPASAQSDATADPGYGFAIFLFILLLVYFVPSFVAFWRRHPNRWAILVINLVFGGTGLGWLGSLIWASNAIHKSQVGSNGGESGLNVFINDPVKLAMPTSNHIAAEQDPLQQLQTLKALLDQGAISEDEFRQLKAPIIRQFAIK